MRLRLDEGRELTADGDELVGVWMDHVDGEIQLVTVDWRFEEPEDAHAHAVELAEAWTTEWGGSTDTIDEWLERVQAGEEGNFDGVSNSMRDINPEFSVVLQAYDRDAALPKVEFQAVWHGAGR